MNDFPIFDGDGAGAGACGRSSPTAPPRPCGAPAAPEKSGSRRAACRGRYASLRRSSASSPTPSRSSIDEARKRLLIEQLEDALEKRNTFLLVGHSYDRTIADMRSGTLAVRHTDKAVELEATLPPDNEMPSWVRDAVLAVKGGQLRGVSPGFQVPAGRGRERLVPEDGDGDSLVRVIEDAVVFEYSVVARPAYPSTAVDARAEDFAPAVRRRRVWL